MKAEPNISGTLCRLLSPDFKFVNIFKKDTDDASIKNVTLRDWHSTHSTSSRRLRKYTYIWSW